MNEIASHVPTTISFFIYYPYPILYHFIPILCLSYPPYSLSPIPPYSSYPLILSRIPYIFLHHIIFKKAHFFIKNNKNNNQREYYSPILIYLLFLIYSLPPLG